ncbi:MAG TPA: MMPL family transporter, partial [Thermoleophilaceae bacterium]|nr:MMPL family transporter [Thermoleophilaceae bacterium]
MLRRLFGRPGEGGARESFGRVARAVTEHPIATVAVVGALALVGTALALRLEPSASTDTLVAKNSAAFKATERFRRQFGDESVLVMVQGNLQRTTLTSDLGRLIRLEGCLAGNVPKQVLKDYPPECATLARTKPAQVVYGPGTFITTAVAQIQKGFQAKQADAAAQGEAAAAAARQIARKQGRSKAQQDKLAAAARDLARQRFIKDALGVALRYGLTSIPQVNNPEFVSQLVFDTSRGVGQPKARFAFLFPSKNAALVQIRLKPNLTDAQRRDAIELIEDTVAEPRFKMNNGQRYVVTGIPVVVNALATSVQHSIFVLLAAALLIMAATLALVFRTSMRLLPLALALAAAAMTYGFISLAGVDLTMASIAALPVLIGLAVDYAIQLQARFDESRREGLGPTAAARAAAVRGGPLIAGAA